MEKKKSLYVFNPFSKSNFELEFDEKSEKKHGKSHDKAMSGFEKALKLCDRAYLIKKGWNK